MRIIGGTLKGKQINPPKNYAARPTTDFAKEGLFNTLVNEVDFETISMLDLFSGTGSISFEAASRGCRDIVSVEMNPLHASFIKSAAKELGISGMQVVRHNVFDFLNICSRSFDLIFADPPYAIEGLDTIPDRVLEKNLLADGGILILEHSGDYSFGNHPRFVKEKKYGNVHFSYFK
ncbi:MAG: RsmD family RNA methyltransferase [Bacteroidales bacterium]|nr:RsmD family RNA methyltransferase [Bacteroidales bacterium]